MTLQYFINQVLTEIGASLDKAGDLEKKIVEEAKKKKTGNCAAISDGDVRKLIIKFALENKDAEQVTESLSAVENERAKKCEQEQKDYQTSLW